MAGTPQIGKTYERVYRVEPAHLIDFMGEASPPVLATPWLIGFLERTAREAVADDLPPGHTTVGVELTVKHLAPTPVGQEVTCSARVLGVEDGVISYQIEARDQREKVAQGFHRRRVIDVARFAARVKRKMGE